MPYITAIFDRTQTDIDTRTSKAFLNVADWDRIEDNSITVRNELVGLYGITLVFTGTTSAPAITSIPNVDDFNRLLENIEYLRQAAATVLPLTGVPGFTVVFHDWVAGVTQDAPDFADVNHWEQVMDIIYQASLSYEDLRLRKPRAGVASCGADLTRNNMFREPI